MRELSTEELRIRCDYWEQKATDSIRAAEYANRQLTIHIDKLAQIAFAGASQMLDTSDMPHLRLVPDLPSMSEAELPLQRTPLEILAPLVDPA